MQNARSREEAGSDAELHVEIRHGIGNEVGGQACGGHVLSREDGRREDEGQGWLL